MFNLLTKFLQPTAGSIRLLDHDITRTDPAKVARMGLVRSFQISAVFPHLSVLDNVRVALQRPGGLATQFWLPMRSLNRLNERAMQLIESVGLADKRHEPAADLSYGRKRVWKSPPPPGLGACCSTNPWPAWAMKTCTWWPRSSAKWLPSVRC